VRIFLGDRQDAASCRESVGAVQGAQIANPVDESYCGGVTLCGFPWLRHVFADADYAGDRLKGAVKNLGDWTIEIVKRSDAAKGFVLLPRRWVVEHTFAWLNRNRRLAKDFEVTIQSAVTWLYIASVKLMVRRLAAA
jgi:transposase